MAVDKMKDLNVYYDTTGKVYLVPNHYHKSLKVVKDILKYAQTIGITVPKNEDDITMQVLAGPKYKGIISVEFQSKTKPTRGHFLEKDSGLWEWLRT